jgi:hypothetical protein
VHSDRVKEIAAELSRLFEEQMAFLETKKLSELTNVEIQDYQDRNTRIAELTSALNRLTKIS